MKRYISKLLLTTLVIAVISAVLMLPAAASEPIAEVTIPVTVTVSGDEGTLESDIPTETYTIVIEALDGAPEPDESVLTVEGEGTAEFTLSFETVGVYEYTVTQDASALTGDNSVCHDRGVYDTTVYYLVVTVVNDENGGYSVTAAAHIENAEGEKCELIFENHYAPVPYDVLTVSKTWVDNDMTRPASVDVVLYDGDTPIDTVTLSEENEWSYTWSYLDPYGEHSWSVAEVEVDGYTAEYGTDEDGNVVINNIGDTIETEPPETEPPETETEAPETEPEPEDPNLPQTGQLWWPVVALAGVGAVLVVAGIVGRKDDDNADDGKNGENHE